MALPTGPLGSSFLELPCRILSILHKKELLRARPQPPISGLIERNQKQEPLKGRFQRVLP